MRRKKIAVLAALGLAGVLAVVATAALADRGSGGNAATILIGYAETPAVSTTGKGVFRATVTDTSITYNLAWQDLEAPPTQAHIHFGQRFLAGGISIWLCSNLTGPPPGNQTPPGTQACPTTNQASISGTLTAANVVGPANQGIAAGEFAELLRAMRRGLTYVNVHSTKFPPGEIRGQIFTAFRKG